MKFVLIIIASVFLFLSATTEAQTDRIKYYLQLAAQGRLDEIKRDLPDLLIDYPDDPGVMLVHAVVVEDISKSASIYEKIVEKYPRSQFADEAYWRLIQFYALRGDTTTASRYLDKYIESFPNSVYLITSSEILRAARAISKSSGKTTIIQLPKKTIQPEIVPAAKPDTEPKKTAVAGKTTYGLQVGIYSTMDAAKSEVERFKGMRLKAEIMNKTINGAEKFAVVIGDYSTRESAVAAKNIVQQECNCSPLIYEKK